MNQAKLQLIKKTFIFVISTLFFPNLMCFSVGHKGKFGHEFLEFELRPNGRLRYANNSQYKSDTLIRKEGILIL